LIRPPEHPGAEPPEPVGAALKEADVIFTATSKSIGHTKAVNDARKIKGSRIVSMSGITEDIMIRGAATADYQEVKKLTDRLAELLRRGKKVRVTSNLGTDVSFRIEGREVISLTPVGLNPGDISGVYGGEVGLCPIEDTVNGTIVIDNFMMEVGFLKEPITWKVKDGKVLEISGGKEAEQLKDYIDRWGDEFSNNIGEFAIGTNPKARNVGLECREVIGTLHFALGEGITYGGRLRSSLHLDGVMLKPTVIVDGVIIVRNGEIIV